MKFKQPSTLDKLKCLFTGHKILYDGFIKDRATPTLTSFIYKEDSKSTTAVGLCFCPRCYSFVGINYTQDKLVVPEEVKKAAKAKATNKSKPVKAIKKYKK